ncbi:MAG: hypothetical protein MZW92_55030 [Comamonadaceae bacterium]|nr:hypothetical protein [Comamonadaceae bacterium]
MSPGATDEPRRRLQTPVRSSRTGRRPADRLRPRTLDRRTRLRHPGKIPHRVHRRSALRQRRNDLIWRLRWGRAGCTSTSCSNSSPASTRSWPSGCSTTSTCCTRT